MVKSPPNTVHNHGIDPSCREKRLGDRLVGECLRPEIFSQFMTGDLLNAETGERAVVSDTGGQKNQKPAQASTLDALALLKLAEVAGMGSGKYERHNYLRGYPWSLSLDALHRHLWAFMGGEDNDPESGLPHMAHVAWHALALVSFRERGLGTDDRYKG